jgi:hypothetical protein
MTADAIKQARQAQQAEREDLLERLSLATLRQAVAIMEGTELGQVKAAAITAAHKILNDNGASVEELKRRSRSTLLGVDLPSFPDDTPFKPVPAAAEGDAP